MNPNFSERILLAVIGLTPQIVTETIFALYQMGAEYIPDRIVLITTEAGRKHAELNLLSESPGWLQKLISDYQLPRIVLDKSDIHVLKDASGFELNDIRSVSDNEQAADQILSIVRDLTKDEGNQLFVSMAGGRKTMGFYLAYALSLFGRPQDLLSHVLVSAPFETHPEFYYPTPYQRVIHSREKVPIAYDCKDAVVTLAKIPFVLLRDGLAEQLTQGGSYSEVIKVANRAVKEPILDVDVPNRRIVMDDVECKLSERNFIFMAWLAYETTVNACREIDCGDVTMVLRFLKFSGEKTGKTSASFSQAKEALRLGISTQDSKILRKYFEPIKSRVNKKIQHVLGTKAASRYQIQTVGARGRSRYAYPAGLKNINLV